MNQTNNIHTNNNIAPITTDSSTLAVFAPSYHNIQSFRPMLSPADSTTSTLLPFIYPLQQTSPDSYSASVAPYMSDADKLTYQQIYNRNSPTSQSSYSNNMLMQYNDTQPQQPVAITSNVPYTQQPHIQPFNRPSVYVQHPNITYTNTQQHNSTLSLPTTPTYKYNQHDHTSSPISMAVAVTAASAAPVSSPSHSSASDTAATYQYNTSQPATPSTGSKRSKRQPLTKDQRMYLEESFARNQYPTRAQKHVIGAHTQMSPEKVHKWYDNRRTKLHKQRRGSGSGSTSNIGNTAVYDTSLNTPSISPHQQSRRFSDSYTQQYNNNSNTINSNINNDDAINNANCSPHSRKRRGNTTAAHSDRRNTLPANFEMNALIQPYQQQPLIAYTAANMHTIAPHNQYKQVSDSYASIHVPLSPPSYSDVQLIHPPNTNDAYNALPINSAQQQSPNTQFPTLTNLLQLPAYPPTNSSIADLRTGSVKHERV